MGGEVGLSTVDGVGGADGGGCCTDWLVCVIVRLNHRAPSAARSARRWYTTRRVRGNPQSSIFPLVTPRHCWVAKVVFFSWMSIQRGGSHGIGSDGVPNCVVVELQEYF